MAGPDEGLTAVRAHQLAAPGGSSSATLRPRATRPRRSTTTSTAGHSRGGWAQSNYERSIENDAQQHMRHVARGALPRLATGAVRAPACSAGPVEDVTQFAQELHNDLRPLFDGRPLRPRRRVGVRLVRGSRRAGAGARPARERAATQAALRGARGAARRGGGRPPAAWPRHSRRSPSVACETLLLARNFSAPRAPAAPAARLLLSGRHRDLPGRWRDAWRRVDDLREALVEAAVLQDAVVLVVGEGSDPAPPAVAARRRRRRAPALSRAVAVVRAQPSALSRRY